MRVAAHFRKFTTTTTMPTASPPPLLSLLLLLLLLPFSKKCWFIFRHLKQSGIGHKADAPYDLHVVGFEKVGPISMHLYTPNHSAYAAGFRTWELCAYYRVYVHERCSSAGVNSVCATRVFSWYELSNYYVTSKILLTTTGPPSVWIRT